MHTVQNAVQNTFSRLWVHQPFDARWNVFYCIISLCSAFINCSRTTRSSWHCSGSEGMSPTQRIANTTARVIQTSYTRIPVLSFLTGLVWLFIFDVHCILVLRQRSCLFIKCVPVQTQQLGIPRWIVLPFFLSFLARKTSLKNIFLENEISLENQWPNISEVSYRRGEWFKDQSWLRTVGRKCSLTRQLTFQI